MQSKDSEWLRVYWIVERYLSEADVLDVRELTSLIAGERDE